MFGYFWVTPGGEVKQKQKGVFRTNCLDCLDRYLTIRHLFSLLVIIRASTNVIQGAVAQRSLAAQFRALGSTYPEWGDDSRFGYSFKNM